MKDITREHTVWCSRCTHWHTESDALLSQFVETLKCQGYKRIEGRWVCPDCVAGVTIPESQKETE